MNMTYEDLCQWYLDLHQQVTTLPMNSPELAVAFKRLAAVRSMIAEMDRQVEMTTSMNRLRNAPIIFGNPSV